MTHDNSARKRTALDSVMETSISRRTLAKGAAWSVPAIALAVAAPAASATGVVDVGAYSLDGDCGILGVVGAGFILTAGPDEALPAGTVIQIVGTGVANVGVFSLDGSTATATVVGTGALRTITLTSALPAGASIAFRTTLSISLIFNLNAQASLPSGYTSTGGKDEGNVDVVVVVGCSDN